MKILTVNELVGIYQHIHSTNFSEGNYDTYIVAKHVISVTPSPDGCVILCRDGVAFDTANDPTAIIAQLMEA